MFRKIVRGSFAMCGDLVLRGLDRGSDLVDGDLAHFLRAELGEQVRRRARVAGDLRELDQRLLEVVGGRLRRRGLVDRSRRRRRLGNGLLEIDLGELPK